jgi:hypothetical protein
VGLIFLRLYIVTIPAKPLQVAAEVKARVLIGPIQSTRSYLLNDDASGDDVVRNLTNPQLTPGAQRTSLDDLDPRALPSWTAIEKRIPLAVGERVDADVVRRCYDQLALITEANVIGHNMQATSTATATHYVNSTRSVVVCCFLVSQRLCQYKSNSI